jgi:hypothetical protein
MSETVKGHLEDGDGKRISVDMRLTDDHPRIELLTEGVPKGEYFLHYRVRGNPTFCSVRVEADHLYV